MRKKETPEQSSAIFEQMYEKYVRGFPSLYLFHKIKPAPLELSEQLVEILYADFNAADNLFSTLRFTKDSTWSCFFSISLA